MITFFRKVISASLSPNAESNDVTSALKMFCTPWQWKGGADIQFIEQWFERRYPKANAVSFNSGRSALLAILQAFNIGVGAEVIIQAFTCVAVPNSVIWAGAKPVYADIDSTLNIDADMIARKITEKTKAIVVQHTLGLPADMDKILSVAKKHHVIVIEDCAHALGGVYKGEWLGSLGDAAFFSFGRDKVISSVFGGLALISKKYQKECGKLVDYHKDLPVPGNFWIFQQLVHPLVFSLVLPLYNLGIGKAILVICQKLKVLSFPVYPEEKCAGRPADFPKKYPNALASLLRQQLEKIDRYNTQRQRIATFYYERLGGNKSMRFLLYPTDSIYLRFPVLVANPNSVMKRARQRGILLGNWYHNVIDPSGVDYTKVHYEKGSCPKAEEISKQIINLPTRISQKEALSVIQQLS